MFLLKSGAGVFCAHVEVGVLCAHVQVGVLCAPVEVGCGVWVCCALLQVVGLVYFFQC